MTIYKSFIRPHLDYGDGIYDQPFNASFSNKIESVQYNAALTITGAIKGSSRDKLYQELGLEYFQQRRWMRLLCLLFKFLSTGQPSSIHNLRPQMRNCQRHPNTFHVFPNTSKTLFFHMSLMNGINLIQTFVGLVTIIFFVMHCWNL